MDYNKNQIIDRIATLFGNSLTTEESIKSYLGRYDTNKLSKIIKTLSDNKGLIDRLKEIDNSIHNLIINIKNNSSNNNDKQIIDSLENRLNRLQLNIVLSCCEDQESELSKSLINALNNKIETLEQILNVKREQEKKNKEENEKLMREQERLVKEQERLVKEQERLAKESKDREEQDRRNKEEQDRRNRKEQDRRNREEQDRRNREEQEIRNREEQERLAKERKDMEVNLPNIIKKNNPEQLEGYLKNFFITNTIDLNALFKASNIDQFNKLKKDIEEKVDRVQYRVRADEPKIKPTSASIWSSNLPNSYGIIYLFREKLGEYTFANKDDPQYKNILDKIKKFMLLKEQEYVYNDIHKSIDKNRQLLLNSYLPKRIDNITKEFITDWKKRGGNYSNYRGDNYSNYSNQNYQRYQKGGKYDNYSNYDYHSNYGYPKNISNKYYLQYLKYKKMYQQLKFK